MRNACIAITIDDQQWSTIYGLHHVSAAAALRDLGVDSVVVRAPSPVRSASNPRDILADRPWVESLQDAGLRVFVAIELFDDRALLERFPDARPVNALGEQSWAPPLDGAICPTHDGVIELLSTHIATLLDVLSPDGATLRSAHFPGFWPDWTIEPDYPFSGEDQWCFCDRCRAAFAADAGITLSGVSIGSDAAGILALHRQPWLIWRARRLTLAIDRVLTASGARSRGIETMLATLPFVAADFGGIDVRRTIGGQDLAMLAGAIDTFELVTEMQVLNRHPVWLGQVVREAIRQLPGSRSVLCALQISPHHQGRNRASQIAVGDLSVTADAIRQAGADGLVLSSWTDLLADQSAGGRKTELVREIIAAWS
ncbi:MAG: hypothetical protein IT335_11265 [Thermomicrobiales bacterium]|nr:hypothetical protein [Thermomicrobiales bacterium]